MGLIEKDSEKKSLYQNLTGSSKVYGFVVQFGFGLSLLGLILRYFLLVYKFQNLKDAAGDIFQGIADFFGLVAFLGIGTMIFGLLSLALLGKDIHLYLRIGILIALGMIIGRFFSLGYFFF